MNLRLFFLATLLVPTFAHAAETPQATLDARHRAFLKDNCLKCHNAEKQKGKVRLDDIAFTLDSVEKADLWQKVLNSVNSGEMPPEDEKQPDKLAKTDFLDALSGTLVTARKTLSDSGGKITMRRLNRREYKNTIRDLLGIDLRVNELPADGGAGTFDTVGSSLFMSSDQFEQYLALGRQALDEHFARFVTPAPTKPRPKQPREQLPQPVTTEKPVVGWEFRSVPLTDDSQRGGLLTMAAVLKVTANGTTTSPVKRGAWVQRKIVGRPPEPPPPNVPAAEPDTRGATTIREILAKHRENASCAACHAKMDPPGFALESYDPIGRFRPRYRSLEIGDRLQHVPGSAGAVHWNFKLGLPVDASGELADARRFADIREFRQLLLSDERQLARNLAQHLVVYATGTPVGFADRPELENLLEKAKKNQYGVRSLIHEVVQSGLFLNR